MQALKTLYLRQLRTLYLRQLGREILVTTDALLGRKLTVSSHFLLKCYQVRSRRLKCYSFICKLG